MNATNNTPPVIDEVKDKEFKLNINVAKTGKLYVFHNKPFSQPLGWLEFHADSKMLDIILDDGQIRNFGIKVPERMQAKLLETTQINVVQMDEKTKQPLCGESYALIAHTY